MNEIKTLSIIIPFHNEAENLPLLIESLHKELSALRPTSEIILVDDGSTDVYLPHIKQFLQTPKIKLVKMGRQMGKGKALNAGIRASHGTHLVFMDGDLQDDPADIKKFVQKIEEGFDLVNGYRHNRQDNAIVKIYSRTAHWFLKTFLKSPFTDINCGFKMFKRELLEEIAIYGNNFRFFPLAAFYEGFKVAEIPVHNRPRIHGVSKYGAKKILIGLIDMGAAYFLYKFSEKPLHFFGIIGGAFTFCGMLILAILTYQRLFMDILLYRRPALQYGIFLIILGIQIIMTGIIGELMVYLHNKSLKSKV